MIERELINLAANHLRRKFSQARYDQLVAAGLPADDREALDRWIRDAADAIALRQGCVFHAGTCRIKNGADSSLPTMKAWGCRVKRVEMAAQIDEEASYLCCREVVWTILGGDCGVGFIANVQMQADRDSKPADLVAARRAKLLARGDCFATREEAEAAAIKELRHRATKFAGLPKTRDGLIAALREKRILAADETLSKRWWRKPRSCNRAKHALLGEKQAIALIRRDSDREKA